MTAMFLYESLEQSWKRDTQGPLVFGKNIFKVFILVDMAMAFRVLHGTWADPEGGKGSGPPPPPPKKKNHKNIGFLSNTAPDPLKNHRATKPAFNVGPYNWCFAGGTIMVIVVFGSSIPSSTKNRGTLSNWTPSDKTFWIRACGIKNL